MVRTAVGAPSRIRTLVAFAFLLVALASCDVLSVTPFPGFVDKTDISIDLGSRIDSISGGKAGLLYDLNVVTGAGQQPRLLLLVEPPSSDNGGFTYTGQEIFMDQDLNVLGQAKVASSLDYFSKPYSYTQDGTILAGYTLLTPSGERVTTPILSATGLEGFAFTDGTRTYIFATPSGDYASFDISWLEYDTGWGILATGTLAIIPSASRPSPSDPNYANLGYQLVGLAYNSASSEITFVLSQPASGRIVAERCTLTAAITPANVLHPGPQDWPVSIEADRPALFADTQGLFLVRRDGWMDRYPWTQTGALTLSGSKTEIVGDRSLTRKYGFLVDTAGGPAYMYRFDPSSRILTRYRRWW